MPNELEQLRNDYLGDVLGTDEDPAEVYRYVTSLVEFDITTDESEGA